MRLKRRWRRASPTWCSSTGATSAPSRTISTRLLRLRPRLLCAARPSCCVGCWVLRVQDVPRAQTGQYGIVSSSKLEENVEQVHGIVEKPSPEAAPSTLAVVGRYVLTSRIFHHLTQVQAGAGGEIQLTDGIAALMQEEKFLAYRFNGTRYDCGSKLGYLKATVAFGLKHKEFREEFAAYLASL